MSVVVIAAGGTITSHFDGNEWGNVSVRSLIDELGPSFGDIEVVEAAAGASANLGVTDMVRIADRVRDAFDAGATGVVVVHGTDTMELSAYVAHLVDPARGRGAVVFTGSMRVHSHVAPDGPQNLRDAIAVARHWSRSTSGVLVCLGGQIHAAPFVLKRTAMSVDAFHSYPFDVIGAVTPAGEVVDHGGAPIIGMRAEAFATEVGFVSCVPGMQASDVVNAVGGKKAAVIEGFGNLNVPDVVWGPVHAAWNAGTLVVFASRVFSSTTDTDASRLFGGVGAGGLSAQKARLLAMAAVGTMPDRDAAVAFVRSHHQVHDEGTRSSA